MNTIPTIFNRDRVPFTVFGESPGKKGDLGILVLNRGGRVFRNADLLALAQLELGDVVSVDGPRPDFDAESLARTHAGIRFIRVHERVSYGEYINIGIAELMKPLVLVIWSDMRLSPGALSKKGVDRFMATSGLCAVPVVQGPKMDTVPTLRAPAFEGKRLRVLQFRPNADGLPSLYPFDYIRLYRRDKFLLSGGFDYRLGSPYWQLLDFGFRAHLWGERITLSTSLLLSYKDEVPEEDSTINEDYRRFYLKNLAVRFSDDSAILPGSRGIPFVLSSGHPARALKEFRDAQSWVKVNTFRFRGDARSITELWEVER